jgi:hypothetical protein
MRASLPALRKGLFGVSVQFIGQESDKYSAVFSGSTMVLTTNENDNFQMLGTFEVVGNDTPLDPPSLLSVKFSHDGAALSI